MTKEEIEEMYLNGHSLIRKFGVRQITHSIGNTRIRPNQFDFIKEKYEDRSTFKNDFGGLTEHIYNIIR